MSDVSQLLVEAMANLDETAIIRYAQEMLSAGCSAEEIQRSLNKGVEYVGDYFEKGEYFIADLMVSGTFYRAVLDMLPKTEPSASRQGKILIGVVEMDLHDIGKDIVVTSLRAKGYQVVDLGFNVSTDTFIAAVLKERPQILLLSGMMAASRSFMKQTIDKLTEIGLRDDLYIIVGGGCVQPSSRVLLGADASARELQDTLDYCDTFLKDKQD